MPQPRPPVPTSIAAAVAAQGLSIDQVDPDHLNYLQHVRADWAEKNCWALKKGGEGVAAVAALGGDGDGGGVGEKKKMAPIRKDVPALESRVRDSLLPVAALGEDGDGVRVGEKRKVPPIRTDGPALESRVRDPLGRSQKRKVEQGQEEKKGERKSDDEKIKAVKRKQEMLNEMPVETLNTVNKENNSSSGHDVKPHSASGLHGVVWPIHIMERPESSFKKRLLRVLRKPLSMVEYKEKLDDATINRPATKIRQTREGVKYYNSEHERNQSYFDSYPDLAKQVENTSYHNQLALLRGFYFWLQNVTDEDQFRPWSDDFRQYTIIPLE